MGGEFSHPSAEQSEQAQGGFVVETGELSGLSGGEIGAEEAQNLAQFGL
jgi:hypothetical protein